MKNNYGFVSLLVVLAMFISAVAGGALIYFLQKNNYDAYVAESNTRTQGSCVTGEILHAPIYNSDRFDYDCKGLLDATKYSTIVFGRDKTSVLSKLDYRDLAEERIDLPDNTTLHKYIFISDRHGADSVYGARYTVYETKDKENYVYALHWTNDSFSDADAHLEYFEDLVINHWSLK